MKRFARVLLLALALLWAQLALAAHGIDQAFADHDEACAECLMLAGMQGAVPTPDPAPPGLPAATRNLRRAVLPAPTFALHLAFRSRAPPVLQS
ncbi:MAG: hypothetical protein Q8N07_00255 [Rhodocyclaceae bacterium]|nr:hypothetical protein [Rhodocyclaceae bacterium]